MKYNAMLGALVGDAAGATLEFIGCNITEEMALNAMKMPGKGPIRVGPGQITDDGELTLALWQALSNTRLTSITNLRNNMIREYAKWYESMPFDMGQTCSNGFEAAQEAVVNSDNTLNGESVKNMLDIIADLNEGSEANGALMRSTAIASYVINYESNIIDDMLAISDIDCSLSHPNQVCKDANRIYLYAIIQLLIGKTPKETLELTTAFVNSCAIQSDKVRLWFNEESLDISTITCKKSMGHVRWGFILAMYFLRHPEIGFEEAIKITLMQGGDTDTNAAIVGGLVGSYHKIPEYMLKPVMDFDCMTQGHIRPKCYGAKYVLSAN